MHAQMLIDALAYYPEAKIILSTSWVRILGYESTIKKMPHALAGRVAGATWHKHMIADGHDPFIRMSRFEQIENHVNRNSIQKWIAIDDLHSGSEVWPEEKLHRLVLTEQLKGLSCIKAQADLNTKLLEIQY